MSARIVRPAEYQRVQPIVWACPPPPPPPAPVATPPPPVSDVNREALQAAEREIAVLRNRVAQLEREIETRAQSSSAEGRQQGLQEGRQQAQADLQPMLERLGRSLHEIDQLRPRLRHEAESGLVRLSIAIAQRILHRELSVDPGAIEGLLRVAFERLRQREITRVRVHPLLENAVRSYFAEHGTSRALQLVPDPALTPGSVIFETSQGTLDGSVDTQLKEIERGFIDRLPQ